jgi:hypothetical protein
VRVRSGARAREAVQGRVRCARLEQVALDEVQARLEPKVELALDDEARLALEEAREAALPLLVADHRVVRMRDVGGALGLVKVARVIVVAKVEVVQRAQVDAARRVALVKL